MDLFSRKKNRPPVNLNLIAIMNIFAVLIIFFVKANVISETAVEVPEDIKIPKSISSETVDTAPEVLIFDGTVKFNLIKREVPLDDLREKSGKLNEKGVFLQKEIKEYVDGLSPEARDFGITINLVAHRSVVYKDVYDVVKFLKLSGIQYVLFIAEVADQ